MSAALLVFAKAPQPGAVKTRLIPALGAHGAAALHARLVEHTMRTACRVSDAVALWCAPEAGDPYFAACARRWPLRLHTQRGADLGQRMAGALHTTLQAAESAVLIGSDCPALGAEDLRAAAAALREHDAVLGPAEDGGYVLIGLRRVHASVFAGIDWGSDRVLAQTRERLRALGWRWHELPPRWDVDRPADLERLRRAFPALFEATWCQGAEEVRQ